MARPKRTIYFVAASACVGLVVAYFALQPRRVDTAKPMTLTDLQRRLDASRAAPPAQPPAAEAPRAILSAATQPRDVWIPVKPQADRSMVGLPFQLSESVVRECGRIPNSVCNRVGQFLERMAAEPRDPKWAPATEARIERSFMVGERGKYRIRALECRSTRCAVEVASEVDYGPFGFADDVELNVELKWPGAVAVAWENDPGTGIRTIVTAHTWSRARDAN